MIYTRNNVYLIIACWTLTFGHLTFTLCQLAKSRWHHNDMHLFFRTSNCPSWDAENLFFGSIWLSFLGVHLDEANVNLSDNLVTKVWFWTGVPTFKTCHSYTSHSKHRFMMWLSGIRHLLDPRIFLFVLFLSFFFFLPWLNVDTIWDHGYDALLWLQVH